MELKSSIGIYCIENIINNKKYIGLSTNISRRWTEHKSLLNNGKDSCHLQQAWNLYGERNFLCYLLEECLPEQLDQREIYWIKELNTRDKRYGYNLDSGGNSNRSISEETKNKHSKNRIGKPLPKETREKMSKTRTNLKRPNATSKFFGVHFEKRRNKWIASTLINKKQVWLGYYDTEIKAAQSYNEYVINNKISKPLNDFK